MKHLFLLAALPGALLAQTIEGTWQGILPANPEMRMVFKIVKEGNGYQGGFYNLENGRQSALGAITIQGNAVKIAVPGMGANYEGKIAPDGNSISGTISQGTNPIPLPLKRATAETAWEIPAPAAPPKPMAADARLEFEVATIKPSAPGRTGRGAGFSNRRFTVTNYYYCVINGDNRKKGSRGVAEGYAAPVRCGAWRWRLDYAVRSEPAPPRGWNFAGILGTGSLSWPTRTEGEKRLLSAMRNP